MLNNPIIRQECKDLVYNEKRYGVVVLEFDSDYSRITLKY
jgi:hypothetical protein